MTGISFFIMCFRCERSLNCSSVELFILSICFSFQESNVKDSNSISFSAFSSSDSAFPSQVIVRCCSVSSAMSYYRLCFSGKRRPLLQIYWTHEPIYYGFHILASLSLASTPTSLYVPSYHK